MVEGNFLALITGLSVFMLLALGLAGFWYRRVNGYRTVSLTCHRLRFRNRKAAMLAMVDEVDVESDSTDEEAGDLSPVPSVNLSRGGSASNFADTSNAAVDSTVGLDTGNALLQLLPSELWLEVLASTAPHHHQAVSALRGSCRVMRRHLHGAAFWQAMCKQSFAEWGPWMAAVGWEDCGLGNGGGSGGGGRQIGSASVASRAWHHRYVTCCRDRLLLRAAARQITHAPPPSSLAGAFGKLGSPATPTSSSTSPAASSSACSGLAPGLAPPAGPPSLASPAAAAHSSSSSASNASCFAPSSADSVGDDIGGGLRGVEPMPLQMVSTDRALDGGDGMDEENGYLDEQARGLGSASIATGAVSLSGVWADGFSSARDADYAGGGGGGGGGGGVAGGGGGFLSMRGYHVAELPALRASWGGRGPSQSQVAKALMRRQQGRVDSLLSAVAQSSRLQRRLVPVWRRARADELPQLAPSSACAHLPHGACPCEVSAAAAASAAPGGGLSGGAPGGARGSLLAAAPPPDSCWLARIQRLYALLASGGAGPPECWVAHLAKGELLADPDAPSRTTCWMLVLCSTRHAVWVDYMHTQHTEQW